MPVTKMFYGENYQESIDLFPTKDGKICFRFLNYGICEFEIDLDIETAEVLMDEIHLLLKEIEGGKNGIH